MCVSVRERERKRERERERERDGNIRELPYLQHRGKVHRYWVWLTHPLDTC